MRLLSVFPRPTQGSKWGTGDAGVENEDIPTQHHSIAQHCSRHGPHLNEHCCTCFLCLQYKSAILFHQCIQILGFTCPLYSLSALNSYGIFYFLLLQSQWDTLINNSFHAILIRGDPLVSIEVSISYRFLGFDKFGFGSLQNGSP